MMEDFIRGARAMEREAALNARVGDALRNAQDTEEEAEEEEAEPPRADVDMEVEGSGEAVAVQ